MKMTKDKNHRASVTNRFACTTVFSVLGAKPLAGISAALCPIQLGHMNKGSNTQGPKSKPITILCKKLMRKC